MEILGGNLGGTLVLCRSTTVVMRQSLNMLVDSHGKFTAVTFTSLYHRVVCTTVTLCMQRRCVCVAVEYCVELGWSAIIVTVLTCKNGTTIILATVVTIISFCTVIMHCHDNDVHYTSKVCLQGNPLQCALASALALTHLPAAG